MKLVWVEAQSPLVMRVGGNVTTLSSQVPDNLPKLLDLSARCESSSDQLEAGLQQTAKVNISPTV
jgi:tetrahydrodipicolinate N-succinyltransferase